MSGRVMQSVKRTPSVTGQRGEGGGVPDMSVFRKGKGFGYASSSYELVILKTNPTC
jgi:hypothetical protein